MGEAVQRYGSSSRTGGFELGSSAGSTSSQQSVIASGVKVVGDITSNSELVIAGTIEGAVVGEVVVVAAGGAVKGPVSGRTIHVYGEVTGSIAAGESIALKASATVVGDLETPQLAIEPGAVVRGRCHMPQPDTRG